MADTKRSIPGGPFFVDVEEAGDRKRSIPGGPFAIEMGATGQAASKRFGAVPHARRIFGAKGVNVFKTMLAQLGRWRPRLVLTYRAAFERPFHLVGGENR